MSIPKVYKSTDTDAPQISLVNPSGAGSFNNVLRKCLVEGYGSKDPAGWTEETTALGGGATLQYSAIPL